MTNSTSQIRTRLKEARGEMTQAQAADAARTLAARRGVDLKLHSQTISDYERGKIEKIPTDVISILAEVYGVSPAFLLSGAVSEPSGSPYGGSGNGVAPSPRAARLRIQARVAELAVSEEEEEWAMRFVDRAVDALSVGGQSEALSPERIVMVIQSAGAGVIGDLEDRRRREGKGKPRGTRR